MISIFLINRSMVSEKRFAAMASEQDYYAYYIDRLGLASRVGLNKWWEFVKPEKLPELFEEIQNYYGWSSRELRFYRSLLETILMDKEYVRFWLKKVGASPELWKVYGIEVPDPEKERSKDERRKGRDDRESGRLF